MNKNRVAICQPYIIFGGRLQVILGIVKALNELGIEPDILTLGTSFDPRDIVSKYGQDLRMRFRTIIGFIPWKYLPQDYQILIFNFLQRFFCGEYQLLIDSGNSQIFLPRKKNILSYVHYPRENRIINNAKILQKPLTFRNFFSYISYRLLLIIYQLAYKNIDHAFVSNSFFTQQSLIDCYPNLQHESIRVIYPPVDISSYSKNKSQPRQNSIISLGRFSPDKKQLEQIKIALSLPDLDFHMVGFVNNNNYFNRCEEFVRLNQITNVTLHPNTTHSQVIELLGQSRYFLHVLADEPFGITAVEAIAAGCIPIVHDSGGQRETVPVSELRYKEFSEIPKIISRLEKKDDQEISKIMEELISNAKIKFDADVFKNKISQVIKELLQDTSSNFV
jgi:glycosyltransferase involved in cell wall biosynthesis